MVLEEARDISTGVVGCCCEGVGGVAKAGEVRMGGVGCVGGVGGGPVGMTSKPLSASLSFSNLSGSLFATAPLFCC